MNARQIEVFHAIMRSPSLTEAARALNITQPAVSSILKNLEMEIGLKLFERVSGHLVPTAEADLLFPEVDRLFVQLQSVRRMTDELSRGAGGFLSLAGNPTLATVLFPRALSQLRMRQPELKIKLETAFSWQVIEGVARGLFDLGLVYGPTAKVGMGVEHIGRTAISCAMPRGHALAAESVITPEKLRNVPVIGMSRGTPIRNKIEAAFQQAGCEFSPASEAGFSLTACFLAQEGLGVALIDPLVLNAGAFPDLIIRPFRPRQQLEILLLYPKNRPRSRSSKEMGTALSKILADLGDTLSTAE